MRDIRGTLVLPSALLLWSLAGAGSAHAFAPDAAKAIATRITEALPLAAHWDPSWNETAADAIERQYVAEGERAEADASAHRYVAGRTVPDPALDDPSAVGRVVGWAPRAMADAAAGLTEAFTYRQAAHVVQSIGQIAATAADLGDPFLMTALEEPEVVGARATFSDLLDGVNVDGVSFAEPIDDVMTASLALAAESATLRPAVEQAYREGDRARLEGLRAERLEAARRLAAGVIVAAWESAGRPTLEDAAPHRGVARVWPNPTRGAASVTFTLPQAGVVEVELFDPAGRRVWKTGAGRLAAGPQEVVIGEGTARRLPAGLFLVRVRTATHEALGRMLRLRD